MRGKNTLGHENAYVVGHQDLFYYHIASNKITFQINKGKVNHIYKYKKI